MPAAHLEETHAFLLPASNVYFWNALLQRLTSSLSFLRSIKPLQLLASFLEALFPPAPTSLRLKVDNNWTRLPSSMEPQGYTRITSSLGGVSALRVGVKRSVSSGPIPANPGWGRGGRSSIQDGGGPAA